MTFLNPAVLFGLVAAAIPVILHLLNLRKLRTIEFSTLTFLKELQQTKIRRLKIRQLFLLLVRTLLVVLVVLAFARPTLRGSLLGHIGSHAHSSAVFIIDDSFSMKATDEHGELFKQAQEVAGRLAELLSEGDEAFVVKLSDLPQATVEPATHDFNALRALIKESRCSDVRRPMEDAVRLSAKLLAESKNANKEVYIISDLQRTLFQMSQAQARTLSFFDDRVRFFVADLGTKIVPNAAIDSVDVTTKILENNKPAVVSASVRNFGNSPLRNYVVSVFLDGVRAAQTNVQMEPWGSAVTRFTVTPKRTGFIKGYVELENDAIEDDNRRYFTMSIPKRINMTIVSATQLDLHFPLLALRSGSAEEGASLLNIQQSVSQRFDFLDLSNVDVLVLLGTKSLSPGAIDRLAGFVRRGGGLVLFPGSDSQMGDFNAELSPALSIPPVENLMKTGPQAMISFQNVDLAHPLFATVFQKPEEALFKNQRTIESPVITTAMQRQTGKEGRTVITLTGGSPFLSEHNLGDGRILFFSVAPVLTWSDFPLKGIFVPLMYRSVLYVSSRERSQGSYVAGDDAEIAFQEDRQEKPAGRYTFVNPDGSEEFIRPIGSATMAASKISLRKHVVLPGFCDVRDGNVQVASFAVNVDSRESDGRKISSDELSQFWKRFGIQPSLVEVISRPDQVQSTVMQSRYGVELWKYCFGLALLFALIEMMIARDSKKETQTSSGGTG